jgi:uncharacterized membrane protein
MKIATPILLIILRIPLELFLWLFHWIVEKPFDAVGHKMHLPKKVYGFIHGVITNINYNAYILRSKLYPETK